jgi:hypothetical protein
VSWRPIGLTPEPIVTAISSGSRTLDLAYAISAPPDQPAGRYVGVLHLIMTTQSPPTRDALAIPVEVVIKETMTMSVESPEDGAGALEFGRQQEDGQPVERSLWVAIQTNLGRPYQVLAGLDHPLVLPTGEQLPQDVLACGVEQAEQGVPLSGAARPMRVGYQPIYQSDAKGASAKFLLRCRLLLPRQARDGRYSSRLRFTIMTF